MIQSTRLFIMALVGSSSLLMANCPCTANPSCVCPIPTEQSEDDAEAQKKALILELYKIGAVKIGEFKLKSGLISPIYFDLRVTMSYPKLLQAIAASFGNLSADCQYNEVCGVPHAAVPMATALSLYTNTPLLMARKEGKDHGTKKMVEGVFNKGDTVLLVEDVITTGGSILETIQTIEKEGLAVKDVLVFIDREQGGKNSLINKGYNFRSLCTSTEIVDILSSEGVIDEATTQRLKDYLFANTIH